MNYSPHKIYLGIVQGLGFSPKPYNIEQKIKDRQTAKNDRQQR